MDFDSAQKKFEQYGKEIASLSHEPLKITLQMGAPFVVVGNIHGDGILSCLVARDVLGEQLYNLPDDKNRLLDIPLPLDQYGIDKKVWKCSIGFYQNDFYEGVTSWKKQFDAKHDDFIDFNGRKEKVKNNFGFFRAYNMPLVYVYSPTVTFYANGNKKELERLFKGLHYIGKKQSQGYGQIRKIIIEKAEKDLSVFDGKVATRPIPVCEIKDSAILESNQKQYCSFRPPYWHNKNMTECITPKSPVFARGD